VNFFPFNTKLEISAITTVKYEIPKKTTRIKWRVLKGLSKYQSGSSTTTRGCKWPRDSR
jgi:hypothetical protein